MKGQNPAVEFEIYGDNKKLWSSGIMKLGDKAKPVNISLQGIKQLELIVTDGGNGIYIMTTQIGQTLSLKLQKMQN